MYDKWNKNKCFFSKSYVLKKAVAANNISELTSSVAVKLCLTPVLRAEGKTPHRLWFELRSIQLFFERDSIE